MSKILNELSKEIARQVRKEIIDLINLEGTIPDSGKCTSKESNLLNTSDAAKFYSVHINTIRRWVKIGELKSIRKGNRLYIIKDSSYEE
jgi:hypothetical protein